MYQLIATDLDGTLLNGEHQISEYTLQTITRLYQQNVKFLIATGRHYIDVRPIADQFDFPMYLITSNGARVHNKQGEVLFRADLTSQEIDPFWIFLLTTHYIAIFTMKITGTLNKKTNMSARLINIQALIIS